MQCIQFIRNTDFKMETSDFMYTSWKKPDLAKWADGAVCVIDKCMSVKKGINFDGVYHIAK